MEMEIKQGIYTIYNGFEYEVSIEIIDGLKTIYIFTDNVEYVDDKFSFDGDFYERKIELQELDKVYEYEQTYLYRDENVSIVGKNNGQIIICVSIDKKSFAEENNFELSELGRGDRSYIKRVDKKEIVVSREKKIYMTNFFDKSMEY